MNQFKLNKNMKIMREGTIICKNHLVEAWKGRRNVGIGKIHEGKFNKILYDSITLTQAFDNFMVKMKVGHI